MILDKLKAYGFQALSLALLVLLAAQTWRLHSEQLAHRDLQTNVANAEAARAQAALKVEQNTATAERSHAQQTQENSDAFTTSQPVRDALARADTARHQRLLDGAEKRAATYRAMAEANAAACRDLADRYAALDRHVVEGVEVVGELRKTVANRDAAVKALRGQIDADRALFEDDAQTP